MMPFIHKNFSDVITSVDYIKNKIDLSQLNHLTGQTQLYLKLNFRNVQDLVATRNILRQIVESNKKREEREGMYWQSNNRNDYAEENMMNYITDTCEDDVLYHVRVMIDNNLRCSFWYDVTIRGAHVIKVERIPDKLEKGDLRIMAFDIETTKAPLKFPDPKIDSIIVISCMYEGQGYLIVNRSIVSENIEDFTYAPKPEYEGSFIVFNEQDEKAVLERFFTQVRELRTTIISSFNGNNFDWPFLEERAKTYKLSIEKEAGITSEREGYIGRFILHMDCLHWVERDAYLPQGSHGLKAVTKAKLGYNPVELDPEDILHFAKYKPNELAVYAASDALATYYLYKRMIHDFIFALSTIIPTYPDEVLRLGSGTLCESLLMAEAYRNNILFPNKHKEVFEKFYDGHLIDSETYIGGYVEALKNGVYRMDIPVKFHLDSGAIQSLIENIDDVLKYVIEMEHHKKVEVCTNYTTVRDQIISKLRELLESSKAPYHECYPKIYHVDVAAMYPNIILTNRLQPVAIVNDRICASCVYNDQNNNCKRPMNWTWKGEYFPLNRSEYQIIKRNLESEVVKTKDGQKNFDELRQEEKNSLLKARVKKYCEKAYKRIHVTVTEVRRDVVCMRENSFYVETVREFRDRRYEYKMKVKQWKGKLNEAKDRFQKEEYENMMNLYESLQLAHKIILNSFYGYVMRRGARWYSMQMAGMVTHLGGEIIRFNKEFLEKVGTPLELDTDGIWCLLPQAFPEGYTLEYSDGKKVYIHYICSVLNMNTYNMYANKQYQIYLPSKKQYMTTTEMSIGFEIDGPYKCIVLPAAREEGKMLKKKYAVYGMSGKLQELKGFEVKRRGELNIVKIFQSEVFQKFIEGSTLEECYKACAEVAGRWYDILETEGSMLLTAELIEYIGEERRLARSITGYGTQKSAALTCAKRLAEFLGIDITRDQGLNTKFIIAKKPIGRPVTERAIPTAIFSAEPGVIMKYLKSWTKDENLIDCSMKAIVDWEYYKDRLAKTIQKIITIPAAMQGLANPFPKVAHPEWLKKQLRNSKGGQKQLDHFLSKVVAAKPLGVVDIEDAVPMLDTGVKSIKLSKADKEKKALEEMHNSMKVLIKECPRPTDNLDEWLKYQTRIWKLERKLGRKHLDMMEPKKGLVNYFRMQEETVGKSLWHVLEISELPANPGYLKVWFIAEHEERSGKSFNLFSMNLRMKRTFLINSRVPQPGNKQVKMILPRSKPSYYLYEMESEEDQFLENYANFGEYLSSPDIEGIYEANISLATKAVIMLSSIIRPKKTKIPLNQSHINYTFNIDEFEIKYLWSTQYLPTASFEKILITHSNKQLRHVWGVFLYGNKQVHIYCLHETIKQRERPNLGRIVKQVLEENSSQYVDWTITSNYYETMETTMKEIEALLQDYKAKIRQPVILILQSPKTKEEVIKNGLRSLLNDFPVIRAPINDEDMNYPALNWQILGAKNLTARFIETEEWLAERINFAKMAGLPICNIEQDAFKYLIDILFAKKLKLSNNVLWYSESGGPDLGDQRSFDPIQAYEDEIENTEIIKPGVYRSYTIELSVSSLAINSILSAEQLERLGSGLNISKITLGGTEQTNGTSYDPHDIFGICMETFKKLKSLLSSWITEIQRGNLYADRLMQHIYRWISSPNSKLYDPALHRMVHTLMVKVFLRFVQKFKEYGGTIVYASFYKIIIATGKHTLEDAKNYIDFVIRTVRACDSTLFQYIILEPVNYWRLLMFKDAYNYGGVQEEQQDKVVSCWNIAEYLPPAVEEILLNLIAQYVYGIHSYMTTHKEDKNMLNDYVEDSKDMVEEPKDKTLEYMRKLINTCFSKKLFGLIPDLIKRRDEEAYDSDYEDKDYMEFGLVADNKKAKKIKEQWKFPENLASHLVMENSALEFIKVVCEIFGLEQELMDDVVMLRKDLFKMIRISEFSKEARYQNPSLIFVLQDVICDFCLSIRDIDICRDNTVAKGNWLCNTCNHSYNKEYIENKLVGLVQRRAIAYQMQDLKCEKCKMVRTNLLTRLCKCTGNYKTTLGNGQVNTNLVNMGTSVKWFVLLMKRIGVYHKMELLQSVVDNVFDWKGIE